MTPERTEGQGPRFRCTACGGRDVRTERDDLPHNDRWWSGPTPPAWVLTCAGCGHDARPGTVRELAVRACFAQVQQAERDLRRAVRRRLWQTHPVSVLDPEMRWLGAAVAGVSFWLWLI